MNREDSASSYGSNEGDYSDAESTRNADAVSLHTEDASIFDLLDPFAMTTELSKRTYNKVKMNTEQLKAIAMKQKDKVLKLTANDEEMAKLKLHMSQRVDKLYQRLSSTLTASKTEKFYYACALYFVFFSGLVIGKYPEWYHVLYTGVLAILLPIRLLTYYKVGYGYYLVDLCYYVNILCLVYIWIFPESKILFVSCFAFTFGTLSFAVITWRNSLVLHSIEKTTSSFIHVVPPVTMYVITHQISPEYKEIRFPGCAKVENWNFKYGIAYTSLFYLIWQSAYHYFITIKRAKKIKAGRVTSFEHLRKSYANTTIGKFVNGLPGILPVVAFTFIQFSYQLATMSFCPLLFKYKTLASVFLSFIFFWASYNGATYYVDVFGKKFEKEVIRLQNEISELQAQAPSPPGSSSALAKDVTSGEEAAALEKDTRKSK
ncbi:unnamed protein product [Kuraishia capsulata CBS 1993]|uniref:Glycerophosphocholine acyltransferase 1 n=1 Tax=Kuraishia capsulata CBS 1993 TaxID=1382522 RepID=W6MM20_9ASCO|nr:uncharacterized protein KUCA_T00001918001 [Kuraishia capsulata CBS 1993]CDK25947.1 unnamed protein product [Kuraishia capsulata CBS 1993]